MSCLNAAPCHSSLFSCVLWSANGIATLRRSFSYEDVHGISFQWFHVKDHSLCLVRILKYMDLPQLHVPAGSPSRGGDVTVYVRHKPKGLAHSLLFCSCVYSWLYGRFNCISFHKFSRQLSVSSLCSCGLSSVLLVL